VTPASKSKGFDAALKGQTVGSQVMAIIPKSDGSSDAKDTQIAVIDILGIGPAATTQQ
jgi:peptidylprolyl isomerase